MNRKKIIALSLLLIGIIIQFTLEKDPADFIFGILIGVGIGSLLVTDRITKQAI